MANRPKRVYLAGPMSGREQYNHEAFMLHKGWLEAEGYEEVVTPFECNSRVWQRHHGRGFDPTTDRCDWGDPLLAEMFAEDLRTLLDADAIALLPDWEESVGATVELLIAWMFDKEIVGEDDRPRSLAYRLGRALAEGISKILMRKAGVTLHD